MPKASVGGLTTAAGAVAVGRKRPASNLPPQPDSFGCERASLRLCAAHEERHQLPSVCVLEQSVRGDVEFKLSREGDVNSVKPITEPRRKGRRWKAAPAHHCPQTLPRENARPR